jgi:uncharacterized protein (DUF305 family)
MVCYNQIKGGNYSMKFWTNVFTIALCLVVGLTACSQPVSTLPQTAEMDELFINMMVPHHEGAVEMALIALERSQRPEILGMAEAIIASQEDEISQMRAWKLQWFGSDETPPMSEMPSLSEMPGHGAAGHPMDMQAEVEALSHAAEPFDLAFIDAMIPHHQSAIEAAEQLLQSTQRPELRQLAEAIIAEQQREIDLMLAWRTAWYPDAPLPDPGQNSH